MSIDRVKFNTKTANKVFIDQQPVKYILVDDKYVFADPVELNVDVSAPSELYVSYTAIEKDNSTVTDILYAAGNQITITVGHGATVTAAVGRGVRPGVHRMYRELITSPELDNSIIVTENTKNNKYWGYLKFPPRLFPGTYYFPTIKNMSGWEDPDFSFIGTDWETFDPGDEGEITYTLPGSEMFTCTRGNKSYTGNTLKLVHSDHEQVKGGLFLVPSAADEELVHIYTPYYYHEPRGETILGNTFLVDSITYDARSYATVGYADENNDGELAYYKPLLFLFQYSLRAPLLDTRWKLNSGILNMCSNSEWFDIQFKYNSPDSPTYDRCEVSELYFWDEGCQAIEYTQLGEDPVKVRADYWEAVTQPEYERITIVDTKKISHADYDVLRHTFSQIS